MKFLPLFISSLAGLSSLIGYLFIYINIRNIHKIITIFLSFSVGIILSLSIFDLIPESIKLINLSTDNYIFSCILFLIFFTIGYNLIKLFHNTEKNNPSSLYRVGKITFITFMIHNFLEGIITYSSLNYNIIFGINLTISIILHNIPEGILISIPIYYSTKNKLKTFKMVFLSSLFEIIGTVFAFIIFNWFNINLVIPYIISIISGIMISLIINEVLPELKKYSYLYIKIIFIFLGIIIILLNLILIN